MWFPPLLAPTPACAGPRPCLLSLLPAPPPPPPYHLLSLTLPADAILLVPTLCV